MYAYSYSHVLLDKQYTACICDIDCYTNQGQTHRGLALLVYGGGIKGLENVNYTMKVLWRQTTVSISRGSVSEIQIGPCDGATERNKSHPYMNLGNVFNRKYFPCIRMEKRSRKHKE